MISWLRSWQGCVTFPTVRGRWVNKIALGRLFSTAVLPLFVLYCCWVRGGWFSGPWTLTTSLVFVYCWRPLALVLVARAVVYARVWLLKYCTVFILQAATTDPGCFCWCVFLPRHLLAAAFPLILPSCNICTVHTVKPQAATTYRANSPVHIFYTVRALLIQLLQCRGFMLIWRHCGCSRPLSNGSAHWHAAAAAAA